MKLWDLLPPGLPWPLGLILVSGIGILLVVVSYALLPREKRRALLQLWWVLLLVIVGTAIVATVYVGLASRPLTKTARNLRILVAPDTLASGDASFAVSDSVQKLVEALHIDRKVEIWLVPPVATSEELQGIIRRRNADTLLWLHATTASSGNSTLCPRLYLTLPGGSLRTLSMQTRAWGSPPTHQLASVASQVALEALDILEPVLPDENMVYVKPWRVPQYEKIISGQGGEGPVTVKQTAYRWFGGPVIGERGQTPVKATKERVLASEPVRSIQLDKHGKPIGTVENRGIGHYRRREPSVDCVTYAWWMHNASSGSIHDCALELRMPAIRGAATDRVRGMLTVNGAPVPDAGDMAEINANAGTIKFRIPNLGPGERLLATATYLLP
ncbi:MAG: hypothetical protein ABSD48_17550, partial [Armatimonadota bacterium]|jgi:hypothetical protein